MLNLTIEFKAIHTRVCDVVKALNDLTQGLKGKANMKRLEQLEALRKLDDILNNPPTMYSTPPESTLQENSRVTFDQATRPPKETAPNPKETTTSQQTPMTTPISAATINKQIMDAPTPRVQTKQSTTTNATPTPKITNPIRNKMRDKLRNHLRLNTMARIPQHNIYSHQHTSNGQSIQLVHDPETNQYLNYHQLMRHPKHQTICSKSVTNEFERLTLGVRGRVIGTDTIEFIKKDNVPYERRKDVMYGSITCDVRPHKGKKNALDSQQEEIVSTKTM